MQALAVDHHLKRLQPCSIKLKYYISILYVVEVRIGKQVIGEALGLHVHYCLQTKQYLVEAVITASRCDYCMHA